MQHIKVTQVNHENDKQSTTLALQAKLLVALDIENTCRLTGLRHTISCKNKCKLIKNKMKDLLLQQDKDLRMKQEEDLRLQQEEDLLEGKLIVHQPKELRDLKTALPSLEYSQCSSHILFLMKYNSYFISWMKNNSTNELWKMAMSWFCLNVDQARLHEEVLETLQELLYIENNIQENLSNFTAPEIRLVNSQAIQYLKFELIPFVKSQFVRFKTPPKKGDIATANVLFSPFRSAGFDFVPVIRLVNTFLGGERKIGRIPIITKSKNMNAVL
jgi:hypothetical protein